MKKCDFNEVAKQHFYKNTSGGLLLELENIYLRKKYKLQFISIEMEYVVSFLLWFSKLGVGLGYAHNLLNFLINSF